MQQEGPHRLCISEPKHHTLYHAEDGDVFCVEVCATCYPSTWAPIYTDNANMHTYILLFKDKHALIHGYPQIDSPLFSSEVW